MRIFEVLNSQRTNNSRIIIQLGNPFSSPIPGMSAESTKGIQIHSAGADIHRNIEAITSIGRAKDGLHRSRDFGVKETLPFETLVQIALVSVERLIDALRPHRMRSRYRHLYVDFPPEFIARNEGFAEKPFRLSSIRKQACRNA